MASASTPERLVNVLEQYRDKLHQAGDSIHDEELDYIKEILASPIFKQYLRGTPLSHEESTILNEAGNKLITGFENNNDSSPSERRKSNLQRKQSLKTLRNVVTPKNSTSNLVQRAESSKLRQARAAPVLNGRGEAVTAQEQALVRIPNGDTFQKSSTLTHDGSLSSRVKSLSNSTSTLIDRSSNSAVRKKSSELNLLSSGSFNSLSGSQPNISSLKLNPQFLNGLPGAQNGFGNGHPSQKLVLASPEARPPPPSYLDHMHNQIHQPEHQLYKKTSSVDKLFEPSPSPDHGLQAQPLAPPTHPMTNGLVTKDLSTAEKRKTSFTVRMDKGSEGLGFMVKPVHHETRGEVGLCVQDLQPGGPAERDGRLRRNDQITHINGHSLNSLPHSDAVVLLQSFRGPVDLVIVREHPAQATPPSHRRLSPPASPASASSARSLHARRTPDSPVEPPSIGTTHIAQDELAKNNQRKIVTIELPNDGRRGFGFSVVSESDSCTVVHSVVAGGIAEQDGRLQRGDQLLQINEESVLHMEYDDIITKLRTVSQAGRPIRLVIARMVAMETDDGAIPEINDSSDDDLEEFEVELHRGNNKGLGMTIAGLVKTDTEEEVKGIYITSLNPTGVAAQSKRIKVGDRILKVDGHSLRGLENMEAASVLRNSGNPVRVVLSRKKLKRSDKQSVPSLPVITDESGSVETTAEQAIDKWTRILGPDSIVKVDKVHKMDNGGLGIRMESTAEFDEEGELHSGSVHHVIQFIHPQGPIGRHGILREGDEILEINGNVLLGLQHNEAIEVVKQTASQVMVVVCRDRGTEGDTTTTNTESAESETPLTGPEEPAQSDSLLAVPFDIGDIFSRRLERRSWRERHEQQKKLIKQRFEQKREEFLRHRQEQDEELDQQEAELREQQRQAEESERLESEKDRNSDPLLSFTYNSYHDGLDEPLRSPDSILESDSSLLSPVPGSTLWEDEVSEVVLVKGEEGLGFSILDFADPLREGAKVILVHSLVEGGAAEQEDQLRVGDRLLSVNGVSVISNSLDFAVQQLVSVPLGGTVVIGVNHPLPGEDYSDLCSPYSMEDDDRDMRESTESVGEASPVEDEEQKPLSGEGEPEGGLATETESQDNPEEDSEEKKKKPDTDDDEPPPPYSKDDPQEEKPEDSQGSPEASNSMQPKLQSGSDVAIPEQNTPHIEIETIQTKLETHSNDDIDSPHTNTPSPLSPALLSTISSPERGRSLSDLTRIKPEEQSFKQPSAPAFRQENTEFESCSSDNTIVNSQSQPSQSELGPESTSSTFTSGSLNSTPVYVSSPSSDRGHKPVKTLSSDRKGRSKDKAVKRTKGKRFPAKSYKSQQSKDSSPGTPTQESLGVTPSQGTLGSSQESSCFEGLSPELSDFGDHSTEVDMEPREIRIKKSGSNYGIHLAFDEKSNCITVKSVSSGSAVAKDGRIRVGDRISSINGKSLTGVNLKRAKEILKKASSSRASELVIVYAPLPQVQTVQVMPAGGATYINSPGTRSSITDAVLATQPGQQFYPQASGNLPVHVITQYPPGMIQPPFNMTPYQGVPQSVQGAYYPRFDDQISKPPPPYMFPHQSGPSPSTAMLSQNMTPYQSPQSQSWNQLSQTNSNVHMMQPSPNLPGNQWQGAHMTTGLNHMTPGPVLRDPPQYSDVHMMAVQQNQQQQSGPPISAAGSLSQQYVRPPQAAHFEHPPPLSQSSRPVVSPRPMNKSHSETKFRSGMTPRPNLERRHKSQSSGPGANQNPKKHSLPRNKQRAVVEDVMDKTEQPTSISSPIRRIIGEEPTEHAQSSRKKEKIEPIRSAKYSRTQTLQESPDHSHHNSWAIEDEEDPAIRAEFPDAEGHLFEVTLQKGKSGGLGLSIVANDNSQSIRGIVIMGIQPRGVADQCGLIKWGDMILKVNDTRVIGMSQTEVQELLAKAPPTVRFVLLRQHMIKHTQAGSDISLDGLAQVRAVTLFADDKKTQFGFSIEKGELVNSGAPSVRISSITPSGPAEMNSLQVGDQILDVDGQQILGYAYEKARLLLQQAKQRGQVTIAVASHSPAGHNKEGLEHNQPSRPAEDVVLRPKKKRSSLKPSRRRPVSVDCDGKTGPSNGGQGSQKNSPLETSRTSFISNRSSQPLTEREMEQGFQYFEQKDKDITPWEECEIIIFMGSHELGLVLSSSADSGIHIQRITPDSPAEKDGRLKPGDRIKMINNTAMEGLTKDEALQVLKTSPAFVHLTVLRESNKSQSNLNLNEDPSFSMPDHSDVEIIELVKPERSGFGLMICETEEDQAVYVQDVVKGKAAYLDGRVHSGDKLLAINGQDVSKARQHYVVQLLQNCGNHVTLKVLHPPNTLLTSHDHYGRSGDLELSPSDPGLFQSFPPPEYPYNVTGRPGHDRILSPYTRVAESSQQSDYGSYLPRQYLGYRDDPASADPDIDTPLSSQEENYHVQVINLHRGPAGLGFSIVGGKGSKHGDLPIFIKSVFAEGAAGKDGRLRMGDQILSVNGYSFENVTHAEAVETLKLIKGDIELTVLKSD